MPSIFSDPEYQFIWFVGGMLLYVSLIGLLLWLDFAYNRSLALTPHQYRRTIKSSLVQKIKDEVYIDSTLAIMVGGLIMYFMRDIPYSAFTIACIIYWNPLPGNYSLFENYKILREDIDAFKNAQKLK